MKANFLQIVQYIALMLMVNACVVVSPTAQSNSLNSTAAPVAELITTPANTPTLGPTYTPVPPTNTPVPPAAPLTDTPRPRLSVSGLILDQVTGQPVAGAEVSAGSTTAATDSNGRYTLTDLTPGQYVISVVHPDYDPGLSPILSLGPGKLMPNLELYPTGETPYPEDPMLTNLLDPNGAPTPAEAERLAREQGLTGAVTDIRATKLSGEYLVNYKIGDDVRAAVAEIDHEVWELTDDQGQIWRIIKVCGNLASPLPGKKVIPTPKPISLPPMAEVLDELIIRACASVDCAELGTLSGGERVEVYGCLADGGWCEVGWSDGRGWCTGQSLRQLAVTTVVRVIEAVLPTATPTVVAGERKIVFASTDMRSDIYVINPDGTGLTRLTNDTAQNWQPAWSPDGQQIVFISGGDTFDIYVMNADGSGSKNRLTALPDHTWDPAWSPDGHQIAFHSAGGIYVMNTDGSDLTRLVDGGRPTWSPDSRKIAFFTTSSGIHVINTDGSGLTQVTTEPGDFPAWAPDGQQIAFMSRRDGNDEIYVINADGSGLTRLTNHPDSEMRPSWSPDGRQIAFVSYRDSTGDIYIMNADGSNVRRLVYGNYPDW